MYSNEAAEVESRKASINESYYGVRDYDETLKTSGRDYSNRKDIDNLLDRLIIVNLNSSNTLLNYNYTFDEVNDQVLSAVFSIMHYELKNFNDEDETIYFYMNNVMKRDKSYSNALLDMTSMYRNKSKKSQDYYIWLIWAFLLIILTFTLIMMTLVLVLFLKIRKTKLIVMSFFLHIPSKSLEEIIQSCDEFTSGLTSTESRTAEADGEQDEALQKSVEDETGSCLSINQQQYNKKYKKHRVNHKRMITDDCYTITLLVVKFTFLYIIILCYFVIFGVVSMKNYKALINAGALSETNSYIEINFLNFLVLMKESIYVDYGVEPLSEMYKQALESLQNSIKFVEKLEDIYSFRIANDELFEVYKDLVLENACSTKQMSTGDCENLYNKVIKMGLLNVLAYYRRLGREMYAIFLNSRSNLVKIKLLLKSDLMREFEPLMFEVIKPVSRKLSDEILTVIDKVDSGNSNTGTSFFVIIIAIVIIAVIFFIIPFMNGMRNEMSKVHYSLAGIPLEILLINTKFMQYIGKSKS